MLKVTSDMRMSQDEVEKYHTKEYFFTKSEKSVKDGKIKIFIKKIKKGYKKWANQIF